MSISGVNMVVVVRPEGATVTTSGRDWARPTCLHVSLTFVVDSPDS